jgi:hypothetical protein
MNMRYTTLICIGAFWTALAVPAVPAGQPEEDEAALKEAKLSTTTADLLEFFRKRILPETDQGRVRALIGKLNDDAFAVRQEASEALINLGPGIIPLLREAIRSPNPEVACRARECLAVAEKTSTPELLSAAVRLLGHRKPPEAAKVLLDFAPFADEGVNDALRAALHSLALRDGKPDPALLAAREDKQPVRRALAVEALVQVKALKGDAAHKVLKDASPLVRLRTALALVEQSDAAAVPALIDVLPDVSLGQAWLAEDVLCRLAGDKTPQVALGEDAASRRTARAAWERWWKSEGARVNLAKLKEKAPHLGLTLISYQDNRGIGQIMELSREGKKRWSFAGMSSPVDFQVVGENRFLVAEMNAQRVTLRDREGKVLWQKQVQQPLACQRLANGNTFIASPNGVFEYDAQGKQVFAYNRNRWDIMGARKHRNGEYILLTRNQLVRINRKGEEVKSVAMGRNYQYCSFEVLPNGNLLLPIYRSIVGGRAGGKVVEVTLDGKEVWSAPALYPTSARRLPNGNVVVASMNYRKVVELDRTGKEVKSTPVDGQPWCVLSR